MSVGREDFRAGERLIIMRPRGQDRHETWVGEIAEASTNEIVFRLYGRVYDEDDGPVEPREIGNA